MPYSLRKAPKKELYWVVGINGKKHSILPLPKARAEAQRRALYAAESGYILNRRSRSRSPKRLRGGADVDCIGKDCPICYAPIKANDAIEIIENNHAFCYSKKSLKRWASTNPTNPETRMPLDFTTLSKLGINQGIVPMIVDAVPLRRSMRRMN